MTLINELRMLAEDLHVNGYNLCSAVVSKAADEIAKWEAVFGHLGGTPDECGNAIIAARDELLDRLEAAESDAREQARLNGMGASREAALMARLEAAEKERTIDEQRIVDLMAELNRVGQENEELRARIEEMERQEPIAWMHPSGGVLRTLGTGLERATHTIPLYLSPGAQTQGERK